MTKSKSKNTRIIRIAFGIFMIVLYCLMGSLFCFTEIFDIIPERIRQIGGGVLILYGFWRGYRHFVGMDYYSQGINKDDEYSTYDNSEDSK